MLTRKGCKTVLAMIAAVILIKSPIIHEMTKRVYAMERNAASLSALQQARDFQALKTRGCTVYYEMEDAAYAPMVSRAAALFMPALTRDFGLPDSMKATFIIQPEEELMARVTGKAGDSAPMGVYSGGVIHILSPRLWAGSEQGEQIDRFLAEGPVVHELAHYLLDIKTNGNFDVWFTEGVALFYEYKYTGAVWREDLEGIGAGVTWDQIADDFADLDSTRAYRLAFEKVNGMVAEHGESGLRRLVKCLSGGKGFQAAYNEVFA